MERINAFILACWLSTSIALIAVLISPYGGHQQGQPQRSEESQKQEAISSPSTPLHPGIQIECDPNCTAKESDEYRNENWAARFVRKSLDDPLAAFTGLLAFATMFLALYTATVARATKRAADHIPIAERAYVKMSHRPPGLMFGTGGSDVRLGVKNYGATPARVTNALVNFKILVLTERLPEPPVYEIPARAPIRAFLVKDDEVFFTEVSTISFDDFRAMPEGSTLCVFGYVDYIDAFGARQRGGYARVYLPDADSNNLGFITQAGYNYDRPRKKGEGSDWDET